MNNGEQTTCPFCDAVIFGFSDDVHLKEWKISRLCEGCQDELMRPWWDEEKRKLNRPC